MALITFLGTGTSNGIPVIGCRCDTCLSTDPRDQRMRCSAYVTSDQGDRILIDCGPDFRAQALRYQVQHIDSLLISHAHFDHVGGIDELRQINHLMQSPIPLYGLPIHIDEVRERVSYLFRDTQKGGGKAQITLHYLQQGISQVLNRTPVLPLLLNHGSLEILGFRIGGLIYITDASRIGQETLDLVCHPRPQILVLNALRFKPHSTHFCLQEAIHTASLVGAEKTCFIHMTHDIMHQRDSSILPPTMEFAWDGLQAEFSS